MAVISCYYFFTSSSSSSPNLSHIHGEPLFQRYTRERKSSRRNISSSFAVLSAHSNPRILKSNRKSRYGQMLSPYSTDDDDDSGDEDDDDDDDEEEEEEDEDEDEDEDEELSDYSQDEFIKKSFQSGKETNTKQGRLGVKHGKTTLEKRSLGVHASNKLQEMGSIDNKRKMKTRKSSEKKFRQLSEELDLDEKWFPLLDYLSTFGFKDSHFIQIYERHMPSLQINMASAQERLDYLLSIGVKHRDIRKILLRQPQILEYTVENNLKSHVAFLVDLGIPDSRIGQIITAAPSLLSYSVEQSLKPTVRYLIEEVGIKRNDLSKVVQLSPQILVQRIDNTWSTRFGFLSKELGAPRESIVKMVRKHPQLLHYNIEDGILPRINFLRSIGMRNSDIVKILTSLTQVLSLSLEGNLKPKYLYLVNELRNEVKSLTKYPMYLSLSLEQRIRPRHKFLVSLKKAPKGPFPLSSFIPTDESFCQQWAGTSLDRVCSNLIFLGKLISNFGVKRVQLLIFLLTNCW